MSIYNKLTTPFKQIPIWDPNETFVLTGAQLTAIQRMFEAYTPFIQAIEPVFIEALNSGKITVNYEDLEGNPLTKEHIEEMLKEHEQIIVESINKKKEL